MSDEESVTPPEGPPPEPPSPPEPVYPATDAAASDSSAQLPTDRPAEVPPGWQAPTPGVGATPSTVPPAPAWPPPHGAPGPGWITPPDVQPRATWGEEIKPKGMPAWGKVLIIVGAVLMLFVIVTAVGCYSCVRSCQKAVETIQEGSYTISHGGETHWIWRGDPQPRDTAPPDTAKDSETLAGGRRIKAALEAYRSRTGHYPQLSGMGTAETPGTGPAVTELRDVLGKDVDPWPTNPWTGRPMAEEPHRGDYIYVLWDDGTYTLRLFLSSGERDL
jgi:hypothetical protein